MSITHIRYLNHHLTRQLNELYVSTVIFSLGQSMVLLFIPIYLYNFGYNINQIVLYFSLHYLAYALMMLLSGKIIVKTGYELAIGISTPIYAIYLLTLFGIGTYPILFYISSIIWAIYKSMYWPAFHADFTQYGNIEARGEEISSLKVLVGLISILGPTIGGFVLATLGFNYVFIIVVSLSFISLVPLLISKEKYKKEEFSIKKILGFFKSKTYRKDVIANLGTGEDVIAQSIWPIFLFAIFANYKDIGILTTIALFIAFITILIMGKLANSSSREKLIKTTSSVLFLAWFVRLFAFNWISVFASDALYKVSKRTLDVPVQALVYSRSQKENLLTYLTFREIALALSKAITAFLAFLVLYFTGQILLTFILAAFLTLFYFYWQDRIIKIEKKNIPMKKFNKIRQNA